MKMGYRGNQGDESGARGMWRTEGYKEGRTMMRERYH
jgi:hypothetical protein